MVNWYPLITQNSDTSDIVIASDKASFALPEVKRGVFAKAGALGRIVRFIGEMIHQDIY